MDYTSLGLFKPGVSENEVVQLVQDLYGLEVTEIKRMISFNDQNFFIKVSDTHKNPYITEISQEGYTFKIINTEKTKLKGHFSSMHETLKTLGSKGFKVPLPIMNLEHTTWKIRDIPLLDEQSEGTSEVTYGKCGIHILTYLPGTTLSSVDWTEQMLFDSGQLLAKFHIALQDFKCPDLKAKVIESSLDSMHVLNDVIATGCLNDDVKELTLQTLEKYDKNVKPHLNSMSKGFVHGDFNDYNIMVTKHEGTNVVDGIIDFEDVHYGHHVWDVCLMLSHLLIDSKSQEPMEDVGIALAGYLSVRTFSEIEFSVIKTCIECRLCQSLDWCEWSRQINPSNDYICGFSVETRQYYLEKVRGYSDEDLLTNLENVRKSIL